VQNGVIDVGPGAASTAAATAGRRGSPLRRRSAPALRHLPAQL